jgi:hypothetical protein
MSGAARLFLSFISLPIFLASLVGQQSAAAPLEKHELFVNVWDTHGNAVRDLRAEDFRLWLNGKSTLVFGARYSVAPTELLSCWI